MIHLIKLCVGPKDVAELRALQARRVKEDPPLRAWTRMWPKRVEEICDGGSIYWVIGGFIRVRQRILEIRADEWDENVPCAGLVLDPNLVAVEARPCKAFQGWRYLRPDEAPADLAQDRPPSVGLDRLPPKMRRELAELCLI